MDLPPPKSAQRKGRKPNDNSDVMGMFRCRMGVSDLATGEDMLNEEATWQMLFQHNWESLNITTRNTFMTTLRRWKSWIDSHPELPDGYLVFPNTKTSAFLADLMDELLAKRSKDPHGSLKNARKALKHLRACQIGIPAEEEFVKDPQILGLMRKAREKSRELKSTEEAMQAESAAAAPAVPLEIEEVKQTLWRTLEESARADLVMDAAGPSSDMLHQHGLHTDMVQGAHHDLHHNEAALHHQLQGEPLLYAGASPGGINSSGLTPEGLHPHLHPETLQQHGALDMKVD